MTRAAARSFTVQEQRAFRLERWSLYVQLAVAVIAVAAPHRVRAAMVPGYVLVSRRLP